MYKYVYIYIYLRNVHITRQSICAYTADICVYIYIYCMYATLGYNIYIYRERGRHVCMLTICFHPPGVVN